MEIDGFYLFIAGEIGIGIFIIMSRLNDTFERIWDTLFGLVLNTIYIALIPFMIWGFFAQYDAYQKQYSKPSWLERRLAQDKIMMNEAIKELEAQELQPLQEKEEELPPQKYNPEDNNFSIPLQQLLEGNHGRLF